MRVSELANRYAKAIFDLAVENKNESKVAEDLQVLDMAFANDHDIHNFLVNPLISAEQRIAVLEKVMSGRAFSKEVHDFVVLLAKKDRFVAFHEIVRAFEQHADDAKNVVRGTVRSAAELSPVDRERVERTVERVMNKKVIMTYKIDSTVIGGLIAQVGSYTFDDSIDAHLKRMNEALKRVSL